MQNAEIIGMFERYLTEDKKASANTLSSYMRDIRKYCEYLDTHTDATIVSANEEDVGEYIDYLRAAGKSVATVSRNIASLKCLYTHLCIKQIVPVNPALKLVPDKSTQKLPQILTSTEVETLLDQPKCIDAKGYRDKAMLELLYATGIRVTELIDLDIDDVSCGGESRERVHNPCQTADDCHAGRTVPLCQRQRGAYVPSGLLEDNKVLSEKSRH